MRCFSPYSPQFAVGELLEQAPKRSRDRPKPPRSTPSHATDSTQSLLAASAQAFPPLCGALSRPQGWKPETANAELLGRTSGERAHFMDAAASAGKAECNISVARKGEAGIKSRPYPTLSGRRSRTAIAPHDHRLFLCMWVRGGFIFARITECTRRRSTWDTS